MIKISLIFILIMNLLFSVQDSTKVVEYYMNGKVKVEGIKINRFKHGKWLHYNEKGMIIKTEEWYYGRKTRTFDLSEITGQVNK